MRSPLRAFAVLVGIIALIAVVVGVIYLVVPVHSLPSFFPGYVKHGLGKHRKRGIAAVAVGVILFVIAVVLARSGRQRRVWR